MITLLVSPIFVEQIPIYDKPYAPIYFDRDVYSWTDKVKIMIVAPAWNEDTNGINSIGDDSEHPIKISTSSSSLDNYKLVETGPNTGIFVGEITLTGFSHDVDGDGKSDTNPTNSGRGPTDGLLETQRDSGLSISFEFADGVVLTKSAKIQWNVANIEFSKQNYSEQDDVIIRVVDSDMNLNPETLDNVKINISSDSDSAGIEVTATETDVNSGIFEAIIQQTTINNSSGNRLHVSIGDTISAIYQDRTLPEPYSVHDELGISAKSQIGPMSIGNSKIVIDKIYFSNALGQKIHTFYSNQQFQIITRLQNLDYHDQDFTNIIQISEKSGKIVSLSWVVGKLDSSQSFEISQSWNPKSIGNYSIEFFVWNSLDDASPLAKPQTQSIQIIDASDG